jgi:3-deoxy-7-phosphoheptulonate synthase
MEDLESRHALGPRLVAAEDDQLRRERLDLLAVVLVRERSHLPVVVDSSHAAGVASLVTPLAEASLAAGAAGLIVEVHPDPKQAMSDGPQSLDIPMFIDLARRVHPGRERRKVRELTA